MRLTTGKLRLPCAAGPGESSGAPKGTAFLLRTPRLVIPMYPDTLLLPGLPGLMVIEGDLTGELGIEAREIVSECRRLAVDRGIKGGGGISFADFERKPALTDGDGLPSLTPLLRRSSSALVGVIAMASAKSRTGRDVENGGRIGVRTGDGSGGRTGERSGEEYLFGD